MSELKRKAIRGVRWTTFSAVVLTLGGFTQTLLFPRMLSIRDFSLMAVINVILGLSIQLVDMGFSNAIIREDNLDAKRLSSFYWVNVVIGTFLAALIWVSAPAIAALFPKLDGPQLVSMIHFLSPAFILSGLSSQYMALLQKQLKFKVLALIEILAFLFGFTASFWFALHNYGAMALVIGTVIRIATSAALLIGNGWKEHRPKLHYNWLDIEPSWKFGAYQSLEKTIAYVAVNFDTLLVTKWLNPEISGVYEVVKRLLIQPWYFINPVVTKVIYPVMAQVHTDIDRLRNIALRGVQLVSAINIPIYIGCAIGAGMLVPILFGAKYTENGVEPFRLLAIAFMLRAVFNPLGSVILAKGKGRLAFLLQLGSFLGIVIAISIGSISGLTGILSALIAFNTALVWVIYKYVAHPLLNATPSELANQILPELVIAVTAFGISYLVSLFTPGAWLSSLLFLTIGGLLYLAGLFYWRKNLWNDLRSMVPKR